MSNLVGMALGLERCGTCNRLSLPDETMTITVAEYEALKNAASTAGRRKAIAGYRAVSNSKIARNPELAEFILEGIATMSVVDVAKACREKFGEAVPSRSSIFRFVDAMRLHRI